jgi:predicted membrane GTPase involved in stress response
VKCIILYVSILNIAIKIQIGETIADKLTGKALPSIKVEEPTVKMSFSINTSPFVGREVCL